MPSGGKNARIIRRKINFWNFWRAGSVEFDEPHVTAGLF